MEHSDWIYDRTWAEVNLDAIGQNMEEMKKNLPEKTGMIGVIKTDAYGHGAVQVAGAIDPYVEGYAVAAADEALELRHHGIEKPILILGPVAECRYRQLIEEDIRPAMFTESAIRRFAEIAAELKKTGKIHLALDTGMNRIGMKPTVEAADMVASLAGLPGLEIEGLFTHFARADEADKTAAGCQYEKYLYFNRLLAERGVRIPVCHCANSAGIIDGIGTALDMVRAGISIYGLYPSDEVDHKAVQLNPALSWKARITYIKNIEAGEEVSYGGTFKAEKPTRVATVAAGYGDGYPRSLSGKGYVLIDGKRAPILGRVCMDQFMVDVTDIPEAEEGTTAILLGKSGKIELTAEEMAALSGRFHYEILCGIGKRVPRAYIRNGVLTETAACLNS